MRVLIYSSSFAPRIGGLETYARTIAAGLAGRGVQVTVLTEVDGPPLAGAPFALVRRPGPSGVARALSSCDVLLAVGPCLWPLLLARAMRRPYVVGHHGYQAGCLNGLLQRRVSASQQVPCEGRFLRRQWASCWRCQSRETGFAHATRALVLTGVRRALCRGGLNFAVSQHVLRRLELSGDVILHGVEAGPARPAATGGSPLRVAYVGRLVQEKGVDVLLKAVAAARSRGVAVTALLVGDGPERARLEELARVLGLSGVVEFAGQRTGSALHAAMGRADVLVLPTICEEAAGLAAMEFMAQGGLVIASAVGGLPEIVADAGLTFSPGDVDALSRRLEEVRSRPALIDELGALARSRASSAFGLERMVSEHLSLLVQACSRAAAEVRA